MIKFGLIPELVGRFPIIGVLDDLSEDQLYRILLEPRNALAKQYKALFEIDGFELEFSDQLLRNIAKEAVRREIGARGLRAIFEEIMLDLMYEQLPEGKKMDRVNIRLDNYLRCKCQP